MQQSVPSKQQTISFEDEDQVTYSQHLSVLPKETEEKIEFLDEPSPPSPPIEEKEEFSASKQLPRSKRYLKITDAQRRDFIDAVENKGEKIIHAAKLFDINYSSAKSILNIYKAEGRMTKKPTRVKPDSASPKTPEGNDKRASPQTITTASVSTQTNDQEDEESFLFKENLVGGSEKRTNPYDAISYHELSRFTGSINDYSGSQLQQTNVPELNNKPQGYPVSQPSQPIFTSINYLSLPNVQNISAPGVQYNHLSYPPLNMENSNRLQPGLIYPQNNQSFSPEAPTNILAAPYMNQQELVGGSWDYAQIQRIQQQNSDPMKEERPKEEFSNGMKHFAQMSYTGGDNMSQAQFYQYPIKLNENNNKTLHQPAAEIRYLPPIQMVLMPGSNQFDPNNAMMKPMFQMIGSNFVPQQNNYPYFENQNSNNSNNGYAPANN